jgi:hypothetical protein
MRKPGHGRLTRRTAIAAAASLTAVVAGGGYALASTNGNAPAADRNGVSLRYITGDRISVRAHDTGDNATRCPRDMYPISGGVISRRDAEWEIQSSYADRSDRRFRDPDEWTMSLLNNSDRRAEFRVFVVCSTADSVDESGGGGGGGGGGH